MKFRAILFACVCLILLSPNQTNSAATAISPPVLKWQNGGCKTTWCRTGWYASPAVADLDSDGKPEVIWTDYRIVVANGEDGTDQWVINNPGIQRGWPSVVVADVNNDGNLEIVTAHGGGWVTITKFDGTTLAGWPQQPTSGNELRSLAVADVDANGDLEILVCSTRSDNQWFLYDHTGVVRTGWPVQTDSNSTGYAAGCFNENVSLADLDGDGRAEMIGPSDVHYVTGYNDDATPLRANVLYGQIGGLNKTWARVGFHYDHAVDLRGYANCEAGQPPLEPRPNFADSAPTIADVNNDGVLEIIIIGNQYDCRTSPYTDLFHSPYILHADRTRWAGNGFDWTNLPTPDAFAAPLSEDYNVIETVMPNPVVADIDGDGYREILYQSYDGRLHAYWLDRTEHGSWPYRVKQASESFIRFGSEPAIVDLDNDGKAEVIFTTWTQKGSNAGGQLIILSWNGSLLSATDLPRAGSQTWDGTLAAPTIANIDADTDLEVVIGTAHTGIVAYDLPNTSQARILWGTGRGTYLRAGTPPISLSKIYLPLIVK
ncbi:MAG: VCBS repeat-containing protein [Chloroflexi bacterium]|nr:VCBS repeat-containing protein [Chloroflexota bacterium]